MNVDWIRNIVTNGFQTLCIRNIWSEIQYSIVTNGMVESYSSKIYALLSRCLLTLVPVTLGEMPFRTTLLCPEFSRFGSGLVTARVCCRTLSKVAYWTLFVLYWLSAYTSVLDTAFFKVSIRGPQLYQLAYDVKFQFSFHNALKWRL